MAFPQYGFEDESWAESRGQTFSGKYCSWIWSYYEAFCDYLTIFSVQFSRIDRRLQFSLKVLTVKQIVVIHFQFYSTCRLLWWNFSCTFSALKSCQLSLVGEKRFTEGSLEIVGREVGEEEGYVVQAGVQYGGVVSEEWEDHDQHGFVLSKISRLNILVLSSQWFLTWLLRPCRRPSDPSKARVISLESDSTEPSTRWHVETFSMIFIIEILKHQQFYFNFSKVCQISRPSPWGMPWPSFSPNLLLGVTQSAEGSFLITCPN